MITTLSLIKHCLFSIRSMCQSFLFSDLKGTLSLEVRFSLIFLVLLFIYTLLVDAARMLLQRGENTNDLIKISSPINDVWFLMRVSCACDRHSNDFFLVKKQYNKRLCLIIAGTKNGFVAQKGKYFEKGLETYVLIERRRF